MEFWGLQTDIKKKVHGRAFPPWIPEKQYNKIGRIWNFIANPVKLSSEKGK